MKIGIDVGSTGIKVIFFKDPAIVWQQVTPTKPGQAGLVQALIDQGLAATGTRKNDIEKISVTGYGRHLIPSSNRIVDEISANAAGIHCLSGGTARTLINIGGQDVKIITLTDQGQVSDFRMNDKCAAGTGRFFEIAATILDTPLDAFYAGDAVEPVNINSTCAVFAESEIVSLLARGVDKQSIIKGINHAVANRIARLAGNGLLEEKVYIDGGPAQNKGLIECLEDVLMCDINVTDSPQFTVAFGALLAD